MLCTNCGIACASRWTSYSSPVNVNMCTGKCCLRGFNYVLRDMFVCFYQTELLLESLHHFCMSSVYAADWWIRFYTVKDCLKKQHFL